MNNRNTGLKILFGPSYSQWVYDPDRLSFITPYFLSLQTSKYAYQIYSLLLNNSVANYKDNRNYENNNSKTNELKTNEFDLSQLKFTAPGDHDAAIENMFVNMSNLSSGNNNVVESLDIADEMVDVVLDGPTILLWDMFGGIGTDSIYLSRYFNVIVTEIDKTVHDLAVRNVRTFNKTNINLVNDNCINMINKIQPHVIYFDPPWGNSYKSRTKNFDFNEVYIDYPTPDNIDQSLVGSNLQQINKKVSCVDLLKYIHKHVTPYIIIKSPINSNTFDRLFPNQVQYIHKCPNKNLKFIYLTKVKYREVVKIHH